MGPQRPRRTEAGRVLDIGKLYRLRPEREKMSAVDFLLGVGVFGLALLGRLLFLLSSKDAPWPHSAWFQGDATLWAEWAGALEKGQEFERGLAVHSPAVAYVLHWLGYGVDSHDFMGAKVMWCIVSSSACCLTYLAARMELSRRISLFASILLVFSFESYLLSTSLNGEAVYTLLLPLIVIGTIRMGRAPTVMGGIVLGCVHGAAMLVRPEHVLLLALLLAHGVWLRRRGLTSLKPALRATGCLAVVLAAATAVCLPWSVSTARATARFNTVAAPIDFDRAQPPWTPEARAVWGTLPAFARGDNVAYMSFVAQRGGQLQITVESIGEYFNREFGYFPEPIAEWNLVSGQGPLSFALANHPMATGGFSKAGLDDRFATDPALSFGLPSHLYLYNHGYAAGWKSIREDPGRWLGLAGRKLAIFAEGATQGLTAWNLPPGRSGTRRAVDVFTARHTVASVVWAGAVGLITLIGFAALVRARVGWVWMLIVIYKVAVTILFYGYARQAASILPALTVIQAAGIDALLGAIARRGPALAPNPRVRIAAWSVAIGALIGLDIHAAIRAKAPVPIGETSPAPQWGAGAFESHVDIELRPAP